MKGTLVTIEFGCHDCDFGGASRNGMGLAAQHAEKRGHTTWVETTYEFGWHLSPKERDAEAVHAR